MTRKLAGSLALVAACAHAEGPRVELRDPWIPPAVRAQPHHGQETRGDVLRGQVERKLRESFDAADVDGRGSITREQARAAHLGVVEQNFDAIDTARTGRVTFEDFRRYLRARGARTL